MHKKSKYLANILYVSHNSSRVPGGLEKFENPLTEAIPLTGERIVGYTAGRDPKQIMQ
jgi:hypothetical protein